jgi:hypothetical protein
MPKFASVMLLLAIAAIVAWLALDGSAPGPVVEDRRGLAESPRAHEPASPAAPPAVPAVPAREGLAPAAARSTRPIRGRVIGIAGEALAGVSIECVAIEDAWPSRAPTVRARASSGGDGAFEVTGFGVAPPLGFDVVFAHEGRVPQRRRGVSPGDDVGNVVLRPASATTLQIVAAESNESIAGARIEFRDDPDVPPVFTDAEGRARVRFEGDVALAEVHAEGFSRLERILEPQAESVAPIVLVLLPFEDRAADPLYVRAVDAATGAPIERVLEVSGKIAIECESLGGGIHRVPCQQVFGTNDARLVARGYARQSVSATSPQGDEPRTAVTVELVPGYEIRGRITAEGRPIEGARIVVGVGDAPRSQGSAMRIGQIFASDESGGFAIAGLGLGEAMHLAIGADGRASVALPLALPQPPDPDPGKRVIDLGDIELPAGRVLRGRVRAKPDGPPISGAKVTLRSRLRTDGARGATSDEDGRFAVGPLGDHDVAMQVKAAGFVDAIVPVSGSGEELEIELDRGLVLRGTVVDGVGVPIGGARVAARSQREVSREARESLGDDGAATAQCHTGADGRFELGGLANRSWSVTAQRGERKRVVYLEPKPDLDLTLVLARSPRLLLRVTTFDGAPLPPRMEYQSRVRRRGVWMRSEGLSTSDRSGHFAIDHLDPDTEYEFTVHAPGYGRQILAPITLAPEETRIVDVVLPPDTELSGVLKAADPNTRYDVASATVGLHAPGQVGDPLESLCEDGGAFVVRGLAAETVYRTSAKLVVRDRHGMECAVATEVEPATITLARGERRVVDLRFSEPAGAWILGTIEGESYRDYVESIAEGEAWSAHGKVHLVHGEGNSSRPILTAEIREIDGELRFSFAAVPAGRYRPRVELQIDVDGSSIMPRPQIVPEEIEVGDETLEPRIALAPRK